MSQELSQGMENAPKRALLKALGLTDNELNKPIVAVVSCASEAAPGAMRLGELAQAVKAGIYAGGCTPVVVPSIGICDGFAFARGMHYALPARELIADGTETVLGAFPFDGAVFVCDGDTTIAGMLMGACRVNIPSAFVTGGPMPSGNVGGKPAGLNDVYTAIGKVNGGEMNIDELTALENAACPACGNSNGMSVSNMLGCLFEAMGLALPGNGTAPATSSERIRIAKRTGLAVCDMVRDALTLRMLLTKRAWNNALVLMNALGGSTDAVMHIIAAAAECNIMLDLDYIQKISAPVPVLCRINSECDMERLFCAGGIPVVLKELAKLSLIDGSVTCVGGGALADIYDVAEITDKAVVSSDNAVTSAVRLLRGNLAEDGALVNCAELKDPATVFIGKAKCFNCEEDAVAAVAAGRIKKGDVIIVRYEGPSGGPGMRRLVNITAALTAPELRGGVALVTDGRAPALPGCLTVCNVCPEAYTEESKLALAADGDTVKIDIAGGRITIDATAKELQARRKKLRVRDNDATGMLLKYKHLVTDAAQGAVLKKRF